MLSRQAQHPSPAHPRTGANHAADARGLAGAEARKLIDTAVRVREHLIHIGRTRASGLMWDAIDRLHTWLRYNPHPSTATLRTFWAGQMGSDLRTVVTHNKAGQSLLLRFSSLIATP